MALIQLKNPILGIHGSSGGAVFSADHSGLHLLGWPRLVRRRSALQDRRRKAFVAAATAWKDTLSLGNYGLWSAAAQHHTWSGTCGNPYTPTAYQFFMHFNIYRAYNNVDLILEPPQFE